MIFVTGPLFAGKREYICKALGWSEEDLARRGIWEVQDQVQRQNREAAGRLACLLAQRADRVIRVFCGLPQALKGELP